MQLTDDYTRTFVSYGRTAQRAIMVLIMEYEDFLDEYDSSASGITITVHPTINRDMDTDEVIFVATAHLMGIEQN